MNKIIPFSAVDGPGNRTAVFLQGCNFNCQYCHNPETIHACVHCGSCLPVCPTGALKQVGGTVTYDIEKCVLCDACLHACPHGSSPRIRWLSGEQVMEEVEKNMPYIRGVTVSGGECTLHRDFLVDFLTRARNAGLETLLDSNGSYDFSQDPELLAVTDGVMLDIKAWTPEDHWRITGADNGVVRRNLRFLASRGKLPEVRTVMVPELFDVCATVRQVGEALGDLPQAAPVRYKLIRYRPMGVRPAYRGLTPPTEAQCAAAAAAAAPYGFEIILT